MNIIAQSLSFRVVGSGWRWLEVAARDSLVGRFLLAVVRTVGLLSACSRSLGVRHIQTHRLARDGHPVSVLAIARPYLWARSALGGGVVGSATKAAEDAVRGSWFAGGAWTRMAGAGLVALGCGRLVLLLTRGVTTVDDTGVALAAPALRLVTPILVLIIGALVFLSGARLVAAFRTSLIGRGLGLVSGDPLAPGRVAEGPIGTLGGSVVVVAVVLAAVAGAAAGLTVGSGALVVVTVVVAVCLVAFALLRPEIILLAVAAFPWIDWAARRVLGSLGPAWDDSLLIVSAVLLVWSVVVLRRGELWTVPIALPTLLALAAAVGSVVIRDVPGDVALFAVRVLFQPLLFYFLGFLFPKNRQWVQGTVAVFILASVALAAHGLYQYLSHAPMPASWVDVRETDIGTRAYSVVQNPNGLGAFLLLGTLLSFSLLLARRLPRLRRAWMAAACVIQLAGVAVTFSRGAWIGLGAGLIALLLLSYRRYLAPLVAAGVVAWFVMPQAFVNRLTFAFSSTYITKSMAAGRLYVWKMSLQHMAAHPWFGVGLGTFGGTSAVTFGYGRLWVDNFYLQLGAEGGLILLALFLWVLVRAAKGLIKGHWATRDPYARALSAGTFGAFVAVAVANLTASVWETLVVGVGFWFLTGLATSAALHADAEPAVEAEDGAPRAPRMKVSR